MPNIKDLFKKHDSSGKVLSAKNVSELTSSKDVESLGQIQAYQVEKDRFFPEVDFSKPETFVRYGSAERYYENAITAIYRMYPYDGSEKEKMEWHNSASYFDNYVFDNLYPRTNGFYTQNQNISLGTPVQYNDGTGIEFFAQKENPVYITAKGGPNVASVADNLDQTLAQKFNQKSSKTSYTETAGNFYDANNKRSSNFSIDGDAGNTVEMWVRPSSAAIGTPFDLWNGDGGDATAIRSGSYGRFLIDRRFYFAGGAALTLVDSAHFHITYMSGTDGAEKVPVFNVLKVPQFNTGSWNHIAFSAKNESGQIRIKSYLNGKVVDSILTGSSINAVTGALNASIGAYRTHPDITIKSLAKGVAPRSKYDNFEGFNSYNGDIDEFRFWKEARTSKDIGRNWFTQVYGGTNTDDANVDLGVYYKFNEGITGDAAYDSVVLDYSGRISNGTINNYGVATALTIRSTGSAMVMSTASVSEFKDPIIYSFHPDVKALLNDKKAEGNVYDARNASAMHTTIPTWMGEDDKEVGASNLEKLMQIMASYFDTLQLQLDFLPRMKDAEYTKFFELRAKNYSDHGSVMEANSDYEPAFSSSFSGKPQPFTKFALQSLGIEVPEIFTDANALEQFRSRDEYRNYEDKLYNIKNQIYQNIYNNLHFILKSKGTEKSFRNLIRCYGVDDELVRLSLYGNNIDFELKNNFRSTAVKRTYVDFMDVDRQSSTVYMMTSSVNNNTNAFSYIPSNSILVSGGFGMTFQTEVYFPNKGDEGDVFYQPYPPLTSSLYGVHTAIEAAAGSSGQGITTWSDPDVSEFKVYAVRPESKSPHAYFQLTSSVLGINLTSSVFDFVYDNEKWNFAVRIKPTKYPWANSLTGTNSETLAGGIVADRDLSYEVSFYGAHADLDVIVDEFDLATTISASLGDAFMSGSKRVYIGAHRTNFTGTMLQESDVRISSTRAWMDYLANDELRAHARDADNKGVLHPSRNSFVFKTGVRGLDIPRSDLLIFEWDYTNVTSSDAGISGVSTTYDARFVVEDISSGSTTQNFASWINDDRYGGLTNIVRNQYTGRGDFFEPNNDQVVDHIYIHSAKQDAPEVINSSDMIEILNQDDLEFTRESRPIDYFYAVEKSMYQTISDEMLRMFATIADFNNLIGEPVNRYRGQYKDMDKLKSLFFESIGNTPDLDKYVDFYKWLDASITKFLEQLFPASANYSEDLRTVVESHVLERNAYRNKFPTLESKQDEPEVPILGINELTYNWKFGHAPPLPAGEGVSAKATIQINSTPDPEHVVAITSAAGVTITYVFMDDGVESTGEPDSGSITVQLDGVSGVANIAAELQTAINHTNGHNGGSANSVISISRTDGILSLTQVVKGAAGNQAITWNGTASQISLSGFTGGLDKNQQDNCLWWNQRAERGQQTVLSTGNTATDAGKQTILDRATTDNSGSYLNKYEGSTYVLRKLSKPYKEGVSFSRQIKGGVNFDHNKKTDLWKSFLKKGTKDVVLVTGSQLYVDDRHTDDRHCFDNDELRNKNKVKSTAYSYDISALAFSDIRKMNTVLPFNLYTTGSTTDVYLKTWGPVVSGDPKDQKVAVVNHHHDGYGTLAEEPMQGPFTERWEGGNQHRHVRLNDGRDFGGFGGEYGFHHRPEAWKIILPGETVSSQLQFRRHSDTRSPSKGVDAPYYRDFIAKRPVVIKNILQTTASVDTRLGGTITHGPIGNYSHQYDIVQTSGRKINNKYFVEKSGVGFGKVFSGLQASPQVAFYNVDYKFTTPERKITDVVFAERFSAPGSAETISRAFLDPFAEEMSVYNAMPFRNLSVRGDSFKKIGVQKGGAAFVSTTVANYNGRTVTITSQENNKTIVYILLTSGTTGDLDASGRVKVVLSGSNPAAYVVQLMAAINSANGHNGGIPNSVLGLTSTAPGVIAILGLLRMEAVGGAVFITSTIRPAQVEMSASIWSTSSFGLRKLLSRHTAFGGVDFEAQNDGAYHKTYRNRLRRIEQNNPNDPSSAVTTGSVFDNAFVSHMIPRSDFQYSWITASVLSTDPSNAFGYGYFPYSGEVSSSAGGFESAVNFATASDFGIYGSPGNMIYGVVHHDADGVNFIPVDFVGLRTIFVPESSNFTRNTVAYSTPPSLGGIMAVQNPPSSISFNAVGAAATLNGVLLNNNGPSGYTTFRQIRNMYHPIARHLKDTNTYSISVLNGTETVINNLNNQIIFPKLNYRTKTDNSYDALKGLTHQTLGAVLAIENYIEPPLSSKFKPIRHKLTVQNDKNELADIHMDHTYANNRNYFANPDLMRVMNTADKIKETPRQVYDNLLDYTVKGILRKTENPIKGLKNLIYKETIFPKERNTYLAKVRGRTSYGEDITAATYNAKLGDQRTFWKDSIGNRQRSQGAARNALGYTVDYNPVSLFSGPVPRAEHPIDLSVWPLDVGDRMLEGLSATTLTDYSQLTGTNHGQLSIDAFQTSKTQQQRAGNMPPTASFNYEYHNFISSSAAEAAGASSGFFFSEFIPNWDTARLSGKKPWFDSYEEYAADIRVLGQEYTVLPEFRISEHMDYYLDKGFFGKNAVNNKFLTIEGGDLAKSAETETSEFDNDFFNVYSHSDFLKHFEVIREQHDGIVGQTKMTITCKAIKKLLPYNGFYPVNRTVQLGTLMSQSFSPYLSGSSTYAVNPNTERIASFMQPFFSPGILYNTIKSGIAVDWMAFTSSTEAIANGGFGGEMLNASTGSYRLPFESLANPQNYLPTTLGQFDGASGESSRIYYLDTRSHTNGGTSVSSSYAVWKGVNKKNYSLAMNNFLAEVPNFFLKNGKFTSIMSTPVATFMSGVTYSMDLDLYKTDGMVMYEGPNQIPTTGALNNGIGQARGIHYGPAITSKMEARGTGRQSVGSYGTVNSHRFDPAQAPWTPPYFYGKSTVRFQFRPHEFTAMDPNDESPLEVGDGDNAFSLDEIVSFIAASGTLFFNNYDLDESGYLQGGLQNPSLLSPMGLTGSVNTNQSALSTRYQMMANSSMNLFKVVEKPKFTFDPTTGEQIQTNGVTRHWIISPKFECPTLNFSGNTGTIFSDNNLHTRGMWRGYGDIPSVDEGVFYNVRDTDVTKQIALGNGNPIGNLGQADSSNSQLGSLKDKLFPMATQPTRIGSLADQKEIFEAVVAIPFTVSENKKTFIPLLPAVDNLTANKKGRQVVEFLLGNGDPLPENEYQPGFTIKEQIQKMQKYVFPPSLDFINNKDIAPLQMYIFEFNHVLDKQDLSDIWQGLMPKISIEAERQESTISHFLINNELLLGQDIAKDLRWMVFKVKQRAQYNYDKLIDKTLGIDKFNNEPAPIVPLNDTTQDYSYNWPYDFFSLVELAKIEASVQLGGEVPITPPDIFDPADIPEHKPPKFGGAPDKQGEEKTMSDIAKQMIDSRVSDNEDPNAGEVTPSKMVVLNSILNKRD